VEHHLMADNSSISSEPTTSLIGHEFGNYRVAVRLGTGGMGTVYRARQITMDRDVALKVISADLAQMDDFTARFAREAKMLASLSHANILKVFDYGQYRQVSYLVM
jgi:serine/threonine-protein kinase